MEAFLVSAAVAALAEIGDKTQLLALVLASRFRQPGAIVGAAALATLVNHGLAAALGTWVAGLASVGVLRWLLGLSFLALAAWALLAAGGEIREPKLVAASGVFGAAAITFFLAEMGDKTQVATVALTARYGNPVAIAIATTLGVLLVDVPAILIGCKVAHTIPRRLLRTTAGAVLALLGVATLAAGIASPQS
jgi:putative Ca2+/H+ antiporter (TMEM165/GDT1 family)